MNRQVVFTDTEYDQFMQDVARHMHDDSKEVWGFTVSSRETGIEITERLEDWFRGVVYCAFQDAERNGVNK